MAMQRFGWSAPALPLPSAWIVDPEPDPDAERYPRRIEVAAVPTPRAAESTPGAADSTPGAAESTPESVA
jgi:hypothetical protein